LKLATQQWDIGIGWHWAKGISNFLGLESKNAFKPACQSGFRVVPANNFPQLPHQRRLIAMSKYQHIKVPSEGEKITVNADMSLNVPDQPVIPFIEGRRYGFRYHAL
jgi:hypothetical protein